MTLTSPSSNVFDELSSYISSGALQSVLSYFGIHETFDQNGSKHWTISIQRDAYAALQQDIYYETSTRTWKLREQYVATDTLKNVPEPRTLDLDRVATTTTHDSREDDNSPSPFDSPDWPSTLPKTPHTDLFRNVNWANSELGSLESWPKSLRFYTHMCLSQQTPAALYWSKRHVAIYNEKFVPLIGKTHPEFMGAAFLDVWPDLSSSFEAIFTQIRNTGVGIDLSDYNLFLERFHYIEETWWRGNLFPLAQEDGSIGGCCFMWNEVTRQVLFDRRTKLLNDMGQFDVNKDNVWEHIRSVLRRNSRDIAMAILYSCEESETKENRTLRREGAIGIATNHIAAPETLHLDQSTEGFASSFRTALESPHGWIALERDTDNFPKEVLEGVDWQGYGEQSKDLVVVPLNIVNNLLKGFIILGLNPRRAFDADHRQFVSDLQRQLITIMTSITTQEQAKQREAKLTQDLAESERRIRQLAELAPMGLFDLSAEGRMRWANSHYFSIMGLERPKNIADTAWIEPVDPNDLVRVEQIFRTCIENDSEMAGTIKLSRKWKPPQSETGDANTNEENVHIYFQAFSYKEDGITTSIMGSITDVSRFIWAESVQARVAENAQRARRRQEEFIDIVSHELRNPLSAVTQCADGILQTFRDYRRNGGEGAIEAIIESCTDAADSILLCATHQKRIVDDVLTLSKLDSDLITLAPTRFQPIAIQKEAMQMFQSEFMANQIRVVEQANGEFKSTEAIICDPARVSQVLVNLITNAIKFQKPDGDHRIEICYGLSQSPPLESKFGKDFRWSKSSSNLYVDVTVNPEYGSGEVVYLYFSVQDTGQGLPSEKAVEIFDKFIQASRRTHVKYGGSGLGLYISRQLTEMQGGRIGVQSEDGVGSTFAFYVKARRMGSSTTAKTLPMQSAGQVLPLEAKFEILLVEDNLVNQKVLAKQLRKAGCTVHVANHGGEAVDFMLSTNGHPSEYGTTASKAQPTEVDCILMDWEMPVLDGLAATARIRDLEREGIVARKQIILGVTANARTEQIDTAMQAGMDAVVVKPFRVPELTARIHDLIAARA